MALSTSSIFSNSSPTPSWKYHVFLSFRGEDTRYNFTDHLYAALYRKGIITFRDDEELERGEVIKHELLQAIEESLFSVVILSQNYASSSWCLDELQKILKSRKDLGRGVLPVFYGIDPSIVRHQTGSFAEAFMRHQERFGESSNKIQRWRDALSEIASLSGYHSKNRPETELIEEIVTALWRSVGPILPSYSKDGLVGIDTKLEKIYEILEIGSSEVHFVGIWGLGGIGKTTLAKLVFNQLRGHFDINCCLENVRVKSGTVDGLLGLQINLLSKLKIRNLEIDNLDQGKETIRNLLFQRKVLLLLDDIDEIRQLEYLAGNLDWFGQGSRIIVTTRDMHLLESHEAPFKKYEIEVLNNDESFELFHLKAFKRNQPKKGYLMLSQNVVQYSQGLPLALEVFGSFLCGRDISMWKDCVNRIIKDPPKNILDTLKISYEGLEDAEKTIFLDIACFFNGWQWHKDRVIQILEICGFNHKIGIQILIERSLLKCDNEHFWMHDLLQEMGRNIVIQKSGNKINKRSRLWSSKDTDEVLENNKGTEFIEGIVLGDHNYEAHWDPNAFMKLCNLRILIILHGFPLSHGPICLSDSLKVLEWKEYPFESLPQCEELSKLVELKLHKSRIKELWNGPHNLKNLQSVDLSYSKDLIRSPNFVGAPNVESLVLKGCSNLLEVHESVGRLKKLIILNLKDCINIKYLPSKFETNSLKDFILYGCSKLKKLPEFDECMEGISILDLRGCKNLDCLPNSIWNLKNLKNLDISGCSKLFRLPEIMNANKALERLNLSGTAMQEVPSFISRFQNLNWLSVRGCKGPISNSWWKFWGNSGLMGLKLPPFSSFPMLRKLDASYCNIRDGSIPDDLSCLLSLEKLYLSGNNFATLPPSCISKLRRLWILRLDYCPNLQSLPIFPPSLRNVCARHCEQMELFPIIEIWKLLMFDKVDQKHEPFLAIPGNEIPAWFDKQKDVRCCYTITIEDPCLPDRHIHRGSPITIDIPYCYRSSEWWGIVLCLLVEPWTSVDPKEEIPWGQWEIWFDFRPLEAGPSQNITNYRLGIPDYEGLNRRHLFILFFHGNDSCIQSVIRNDHDQINLYLWAVLRMISYCDYGQLKISRCGWRVICKDEVWQKASISDCENLPSDSKHSNGFNESRLTEMYGGKQNCDIFKTQDAIFSDEEPNLEHHQAQLRKLE